VSVPATKPSTVPAPRAPNAAGQAPAGPRAIASLADEAARQAALDSMKRRATGLLVFATVLFVVARALESRWSWLAIVRATAEAGMVGGLADWFAVTALFRHPLGIPIPHTAIVPAKKDRVGRTLGAFVQRNFLTRDVIEHRLRSMQVGLRLAEWLADADNARTIARSAATAMSSAAQMLRDEDVQEMIDRSLAERVRAMHLAPVLGKVLTVMTEGDRHQEVLDEVIELASRVVNDNSEVIRNRIEQETPWWIPTAVDEKIFKRVLGAIQRLLKELSADPNHALRPALRRVASRIHRAAEHVAGIRGARRRVEGEFLDNDAARRLLRVDLARWESGAGALRVQPRFQGPERHRDALTTFGQKRSKIRCCLPRWTSSRWTSRCSSSAGIRTRLPS
jgi:uncharacterized membrane-anchored protein YjiN (DUF445 family)